MNSLRALLGGTPPVDAHSKRTREESAQKDHAKKPHKVNPIVELLTIMAAIAVSATLRIGMFPPLKTRSTTVTKPEGFAEPTPRLTCARM